MGGQARQAGLTGFVQGLTYGVQKNQEEERERRRRREEFQMRLEYLVAQRQIDAQFPEQPRPKELSPIQGLEQNILQNQQALFAPQMMEQQMNQIALQPDGQEQLGLLQGQYGQAIQQQQQAEIQRQLLEKQTQALTGAGLIGQRGGGSNPLNILNQEPPQQGPPSVSLREQAVEELVTLGQPVTESNIREVMRQLQRK